MADPKITITATDQTAAAFASVTRNIDRLRGSYAAIAATVTAVGGTFAAFAATVRSAVNAGDELFKLSQKVGISVEKLSELKFAADLSGVSMDQLALGLRGMATTLTAAVDATSKEAQLLRELGITAKDPLGAFRQLADAIQALPDGVTKTALAGELLGRRVGSELVPLLNQGAAGLDNLGLSARKLGLIISTDTARASEEFNDNLRKLGTAAEALGITIASKVIKPLADYTGQLAKAKEEGRLWNGVIEQGIKLAVKAAEFLPGSLGQLAEVGTAALQANAAAAALSIQQRTAVGRIRGAPDPAVDPDREARVACTLSGGTWDPRARRCIPKSQQSKGISADELFAQAALKRLQLIDQAEEDATKAEQARLDAESDRALARVKNLEDIQQQANDLVKRNQELAQSYVDLVDPTAQWVRKLDVVRNLLAEGFLTPDQARESEFAIQNMIDDINSLKEQTKESKTIAEELGLTFSSAFEDAVVGGKRLGETLRALEQDILRIVTRKLVTKPLGAFVTDKVKGSGIQEFFANLLGPIFGGARAFGGPVAAGVPYLVGERGPELFIPKQSGRISPNGGERPIKITVNMPSGTSRETALQAAARVGQAVQVAMRRNG